RHRRERGRDAAQPLADLPPRPPSPVHPLERHRDPAGARRVRRVDALLVPAGDDDAAAEADAGGRDPPRGASRRTIAGMGTAALLLLLALAPPNPCDSPQTQVEMNRCAREELRRTDARLNVAYGRLLARLDANRRAKLQKAERAWVAFRDAQC